MKFFVGWAFILVTACRKSSKSSTSFSGTGQKEEGEDGDDKGEEESVRSTMGINSTFRSAAETGGAGKKEGS
jgi:major membrane immunogen (membrane-anchored lipoprotein)